MSKYQLDFETNHEATQSVVSPKVYSVSELSSAIKLFVEANFEYVKLRGEVQDCKVHSSGHVYFVLKDASSVIDAICWRGVHLKSQVKLKDGLEIVCNCRVTTYPMRSKYQVVVNSYEIVGEGELLKIIEYRKKKLLADGVFANKRKLPFMPRLIGVITSETGAVIRDIMHRITDRDPSVNVLLWPVLVQGQGASEQIVKAINCFNAFKEKPEILIIARGGGSLEDLMPFNVEDLARAIYKSAIPVVSAVGHETDTTICDFAADLRAPTPTAAAEMVVPVRNELRINLANIVNRLNTLIANLINTKALKIESLCNAIPSVSAYLGLKDQMLDYLIEKFQNAQKAYLEKRERTIELLATKLDGYSYIRILQRGFILASKGKKIVRSAEELAPGDYLSLTFYDGTVNTSVVGKGE